VDVRASGALLASTLLLFSARDAAAYRPFDGTDAAVAAQGDFELELGPAHFYALGDRHYLLAPATVLNFGLVKDLELLVDFKQFVGLQHLSDESQVRLLDTDVFLKYVLRRGKLQDETGPSVAFEGGPLLPTLHGAPRFGAQGDFILSYRWRPATVHFNEQIAYTRRESVELFSSVILEGPRDLVARPVAEIFVAGDTGEGMTFSGLVGAIWTVKESFSLDLGLRAARVTGDRAAEVRLGFTWATEIIASRTKVASRRR
jgi:hypothetical protein